MTVMRPAVKRCLLYATIAVVLTAVFMAYLQPSFILDLANRIVLCF